MSDPSALRSLLAELAELGFRLLLMPPRSPPRRTVWRSAALARGQPPLSPATPPADLPDIYRDILEALADGRHRTARALADRAGYRLGSHFRGILAAMRRAGLILHDDQGYYHAG
jgi:hypothetical protein